VSHAPDSTELWRIYLTMVSFPAMVAGAEHIKNAISESGAF